jgi:hypothetical protein
MDPEALVAAGAFLIAVVAVCVFWIKVVNKLFK